jgi:hypothetical protein
MRNLLPLFLIVSAPLAGQQGLPANSIPITLPLMGDGRPFVVKLPDAVSAEKCFVTSQQTGPAGGFSGTVSTPVDRRTIEIPTGKTFRTLKAIVWCRGYQTVTIDVPSLATSSFQATLILRPQSTLRITGRIQSGAGADLSGQELQVGFDAPWQCFEAPDCFFSPIPIASARISAGGAFVFDVPDVLTDPIVRTSAYRGSFSMSVNAPSISPATIRLGPAVPVASSYPDSIVLSVIK